MTSALSDARHIELRTLHPAFYEQASRGAGTGERDNALFLFAARMNRSKVPSDDAMDLELVMWESIDQDGRDRIEWSIAREKVDRIYASPEHMHARAALDRSPARWQNKEAGGLPILPATASTLDHAVAYTRAGFAVIPIGAQSKKPLVRWSPYQTHGPTEEEVVQWFTDPDWPDANLAILTGLASQLVVLDFDVWDQLVTHPLFDHWRAVTTVVKTNRGGHVYLRTSEPIRTSKIGKVDIKGHPAYVVAPPSIHVNGTEYERIDQAETDAIELIAGTMSYITDALAPLQGPQSRVTIERDGTREPDPAPLPADSPFVVGGVHGPAAPAIPADPTIAPAPSQTVADAMIESVFGIGNQRKPDQTFHTNDRVPDELLAHMADRKTYSSVYADLKRCRRYLRTLADENDHRQAKVMRCKCHGCPDHARWQARSWVEKHKARLDKFERPAVIRFRLGRALDDHVPEEAKRIRAALQKAKFFGDTITVPSGEVVEGFPLYDVLAVGDGFDLPQNLPILKTVAAGVAMDIETYTSAASAAFFMLWSGYSGEALWNDPAAWITWQAETKNRHTVRGIDNGARAGSGVAGSKPDPVACEQCGATMKAVKNGRQYTEKEIQALVEAGLAKPLSGGRFQLLGDLEDLTDDQRGPPEPRERELW